MEDFVPEAVNPMEEEKQNPEPANGNGFINHIISNLVTPKSDVDDEQNKSEQAEKETTNRGEDEEKSGGLFGHIISNLVTPSSPKTGNVEAFDGANDSGLSSQEEVGGGGDGGGGGGEGGGAINKFMSNLFHHYEGETGEENKKKQKVEDESKVEKTEDGGGIIDNIVSQLPTSLPDNAAPTSDEATILIHIVQD